ncbi:D-methionine-binding lipoprotein MetQ [Microbacterium sp. No. 7]|nr:D-methionine-binding lipoprotein MetQ [Microbacterium sp. No. 7]
MVSSRRLRAAGTVLAAALLFTACASATPAETPATDAAEAAPVTLRVAAVTSPMTDIVEAAGEAIDPAYEIELVEVSDYVTVNRMLADGDIDANFAQHTPFMEEFNAKNGADLHAVQPVYNFVIAFYSKTIDDIADLPDGGRVAIPDDASNTGRALKLLASEGLIELDPAVDPYAATVDDIAQNPKSLQFQQVSIMQLNTAYDEADLVFQWPSHIAALGLNPYDDGLITELDDRFALQLVVPGDRVDDPSTAALAAAFGSDEVRAIIEANPSIEVAF